MDGWINEGTATRGSEEPGTIKAFIEGLMCDRGAPEPFVRVVKFTKELLSLFVVLRWGSLQPECLWRFLPVLSPTWMDGTFCAGGLCFNEKFAYSGKRHKCKLHFDVFFLGGGGRDVHVWCRMYSAFLGWAQDGKQRRLPASHQNNRVRH